MYFVYLLASRRYGTLYVGLTFDLAKRVAEHKAKLVRGFTAKYGLTGWFGMSATRITPRHCGGKSRSKNGSATGKINLIEAENPYWFDLAPPSRFDR